MKITKNVWTAILLWMALCSFTLSAQEGGNTTGLTVTKGDESTETLITDSYIIESSGTYRFKGTYSGIPTAAIEQSEGKAVIHVEAEAGNQGLMGKRLVCDVILNRADSKDFPDNIFDVINQKNQFSVVSNGRIFEVSVSDETFEACRLELEERTDKDILYFTAGGYSACGSPAYKYKDHYFSR